MRRERRRVWALQACADPYTYGMTPAERREVNARALAAMEGLPYRWHVRQHCQLCGRFLTRRAPGATMRRCSSCRASFVAMDDLAPELVAL